VTYPLAGLLAIRDFRLDAAARAVSAAEAALAAAHAEQEARERQWRDYQTWRGEEVERRYRAIMGEVLPQAELDAFKAGLARLADEELRHEAAVHEAERATEAAHAAVTEARAAWRAADRERQKILHHRDEWQKTAAKEETRKEDLEMEEFKPVLFEMAAEAEE